MNKEYRAFELAASVPWAIREEALENILTISRRENDIEAVQAKLGKPLQNTRRTSVRDNGVAVIPVTGPIFRYASMFTEISGATSVATLATDFSEAIDNPNVRAIVLEIDSPGGQAAGISEFANMVRASAKPVTAYVSGDGASAAYWIASAAHELVIADTAMVGSIGVIAGRTIEKETGRVEFVSSQSPKKRVDITSDEGKKTIQATVDELADVFVDAVANFRGVSRETVLAKFGEGGLLVGKTAVSVGMADRLGSLESVIAGFAGVKPKQKGANKMASENKPEAGPVLSLESLKADHPAIYQAAYNDGVTAGKAAEMQRIQDVEKACLPGHEKLIASLKFDGKTTAGEAALAVLAAEQNNRASALQSFKDSAPKAVSQPAQDPTPAAAADDDAPLEDRCKKSWGANSGLRAEFGGDYAAFLAYEQANSDGLVKVLTK